MRGQPSDARVPGNFDTTPFEIGLVARPPRFHVRFPLEAGDRKCDGYLRPAKRPVKQPVVALRRRGDGVPQYTKEEEVETAPLGELLDERMGAFDGAATYSTAFIFGFSSPTVSQMRNALPPTRKLYRLEEKVQPLASGDTLATW